MKGHLEHPATPPRPAHASLGTHEGDGGHGIGHGEADHGTFKSYLTGFVLAVILTAIPFWLVMAKVFDKSSTTGLVVLAFAAVQIVVHMVYFLHMNSHSEGGWTMLALIFTSVLVAIMLSGSIWIMYHLNNNMMPGMMPEAVATEPVPESIAPSLQQGSKPDAPPAPLQQGIDKRQDVAPGHSMR